MVLQVLAVASAVAAAYFHVGRLSDLFLVGFGAAMLAIAVIGMLFRDRIDLDGA